MAEAVAIGGHIARLEHRRTNMRLDALNTLCMLESATLAQHADAVVAMLEDSFLVRRVALKTLARLEPETLAQHAGAVVARLEDSEAEVRRVALETLARLEPETLAQHAGAVAARLEDDVFCVRGGALYTLGKLEPATLALHAAAVIGALELRDHGAGVRRGRRPLQLPQRYQCSLAHGVRCQALATMRQLEPPTLAQHAGAVVARLEDDDCDVRRAALVTLRQLEPPMLAQHAGAVVARLDDVACDVRFDALATLSKLEPPSLAQHGDALVARFKDGHAHGCSEVLAVLSNRFPRFVALGIDFDSAVGLDFYYSLMSRRRLARLAWYRCRLRLRVQRLALYWYALPYRPSGPGHARDVEAWDRMTENQDHQPSITTAATRRKRCKTVRNAGTQQNGRQARLRSRNTKNPRSEF